MKQFLFTSFFLCAAILAFAQDAKTPSLTDVQKLQVQNVLQRLENAQLRVQLVQTEAQTLLKTLTVPGYQLDLQTLTYSKQPDSKQPEAVK